MPVTCGSLVIRLQSQQLLDSIIHLGVEKVDDENEVKDTHLGLGCLLSLQLPDDISLGRHFSSQSILVRHLCKE